MKSTPFRWLFVESDERGGGGSYELLSVSASRGVLPRAHVVGGEPRADDLSAYKVCRAGDVVLNRMSAYQGALGLAGQIGIVSPDYAVLRPTARVVDRYLAYMMRSSWFVAEMTSRLRGIGSPGSTSVRTPRVNVHELGDIRVQLPSEADQWRIADFLDDRVARIDQIITARRHQGNHARELTRRSVMDRLLDRDFEQLGFSPWFTVSGSRRVLRLGSKWSVIDCKHRTPVYMDSGFPVISPGDISPGRLDLRRATRFVGDDDYCDLADDLRRCRCGDVVYSRNASAGTAAYVESDEPFTMGQDVCRITSSNDSQLYLAHCLNYLSQPQLDSVRVGSTFTRINVEQINALLIPYREPAEQADVARDCDQLIENGVTAGSNLKRSLTVLQEYKQSLITAAVTGEFDVTTASASLP